MRVGAGTPVRMHTYARHQHRSNANKLTATRRNMFVDMAPKTNTKAATAAEVSKAKWNRTVHITSAAPFSNTQQLQNLTREPRRTKQTKPRIPRELHNLGKFIQALSTRVIARGLAWAHV